MPCPWNLTLRTLPSSSVTPAPGRWSRRGRVCAPSQGWKDCWAGRGCGCATWAYRPPRPEAGTWTPSATRAEAKEKDKGVGQRGGTEGLWAGWPWGRPRVCACWGRPRVGTCCVDKRNVLGAATWAHAGGGHVGTWRALSWVTTICSEASLRSQSEHAAQCSASESECATSCSTPTCVSGRGREWEWEGVGMGGSGRGREWRGSECAASCVQHTLTSGEPMREM
eukprot:3326495-Prymnesium_polylepis.1